jgi:arginase
VKKEIIFIENMSELGAGTRGASLGFAALEMAALKFNLDLFNRYPIHTVPSNNIALYKKVINTRAKHIDDIVETNKNASNYIRSKMVPY